MLGLCFFQNLDFFWLSQAPNGIGPSVAGTGRLNWPTAACACWPPWVTPCRPLEPSSSPSSPAARRTGGQKE